MRVFVWQLINWTRREIKRKSSREATYMEISGAVCESVHMTIDWFLIWHQSIFCTIRTTHGNYQVDWFPIWLQSSFCTIQTTTHALSNKNSFYMIPKPQVQPCLLWFTCFRACKNKCNGLLLGLDKKFTPKTERKSGPLDHHLLQETTQETSEFIT